MMIMTHTSTHSEFSPHPDEREKVAVALKLSKKPAPLMLFLDSRTPLQTTLVGTYPSEVIPPPTLPFNSGLGGARKRILWADFKVISWPQPRHLS